MTTTFDSREHGLGPDPALVREVLVVRPGGLGDMVKAVPALRHLRGVYPDARITVAARASGLDLVTACPYIDRCIPLERPSELLLERFDVAISFVDPYDSTRFAGMRAVRELTAATHVSYRRTDVPSLMGVHPEWPARMPEAQRMLRLVWLLGGVEPDSSLSLWPSLADRNGAARLVGRVRRPMAIVHPGAGAADRRWPAAAFGAVTDALFDLGLLPVVVGLGRDAEVVAQLREHASRRLVDLTGRTSVGVLTGIMERAAVFVGNDSGPAALAQALGVQSVVIGPASRLEQTGLASQVTYVTAPACADCGEVTCAHALAPASAIALDEVLGQVTLSASRARKRWQRQQLSA